MEFNTISKPVLEPDHVYVFFLKHLQNVSKMRQRHFSLVRFYSYYAIIGLADVLIRIWLMGPLRELLLRLLDQKFIYVSLQWKKVFSYN